MMPCKAHNTGMSLVDLSSMLAESPMAACKEVCVGRRACTPAEPCIKAENKNGIRACESFPGSRITPELGKWGHPDC